MFGHNSNKTCPVHNLSEKAAEPIFGSMTFFEFNRILGGACTAFAFLVILVHVLVHATHLSVPREQVKIMRVARLIPLYSVFSLLCICFPAGAVYLRPWLDVFQAGSLASYFLLLCEYVSPHKDGRDLFFSTVEIKGRKAKEGPVDGVEWFRQRWVGVFQYPPVALLVAIATAITQAAGVYCEYKSMLRYASLWLSIVSNISVTIAFMSVMFVALTLKPHMPDNKTVSKLVAIKLVVALGFLQTIVWWILKNTHALDPTDKFTYADLQVGLPALLHCIEMIPISILMVWSYPVRPYIYNRKNPSHSRLEQQQEYIPSSYQGGFLGFRAFLAVWDPRETIKGVLFAIKLLMGSAGNYVQSRTGDYHEYR